MKILKFCMLLSLPTAMACGGNTPKEVLTVRVDNEFTSLYMPDSCGVTSADGTISILLDDGSSLFMTGDCFVGNVVDGKRKPGEKMINNSLVHIGSDYRYLARTTSARRPIPVRCALRPRPRRHRVPIGIGRDMAFSTGTYFIAS